MHRFLNLLLSIITLSLHGKYHLQQIKITRDEIDSINGFNCTNILGAQVNSNGTCACTSATTILSDENGRLKCENLVEDTFPNCDIEKITNLPQNDGSQTDGIEIEFDNHLSCVTTLHNSALWNMDSKGGYWHHSNDIKTYLIIDSQGSLKVNNSDGQLNGLVLKLQFRCNSTSITQCVMLTIYGTRSYPVTQFNRSSILPIPTITLTTTLPITLPSAATKSITTRKIESTTTTTKTSLAAATKTTTEATATSTTIGTATTKREGRTITKTTQPTSQTLKSKPMISVTSRSADSTSKNSNKTQGDVPIMQKISDNNHNVTIAAAAASIAMLLSAILLLYLWRRRKQKKSLCKVAKRSSTEVSTELEPDYLKPIDARRNSQESTVYEIFGDEFASAVFRYVVMENTQYNEITPYYQDITPVHTSLSLNKPSPGKDHSNKRLFTCSQDFADKTVSVALNPSLSLEGSDFSQYYQYFKPVFPDPPKSDQTLPEEHIYRELERPERGDLIPPANVKSKQDLVPSNSLKQSDEQMPQYCELTPEYQDLKPIHIDLCKDNPAFVGKHV